MVTLVWGGGEGVWGRGPPPSLVFNYSKEALGAGWYHKRIRPPPRAQAYTRPQRVPPGRHIPHTFLGLPCSCRRSVAFGLLASSPVYCEDRCRMLTRTPADKNLRRCAPGEGPGDDIGDVTAVPRNEEPCRARLESSAAPSPLCPSVASANGVRVRVVSMRNCWRVPNCDFPGCRSSPDDWESGDSRLA